ncbi:GNAT family N-acetyltransferase [Lacticaseibacillus pabuli]|uniref:GNAT family N-acetyltransferase n=1 Tax=Lacticaseibacillus pabuli TaxID=3025672 RepID=A0ABY7WT29_9LACO|nr:GNAT family N-acetyltransferase [Lacticaseibacillus sp. KACC 23028]WDF82598.1 GNAT family N-acetyltransferase [Lacticaseibacillus sp. KACC 23028]
MKIRAMIPTDRPQLRRLYLHTRQQTFTWEDPADMRLQDFDQDTAGELVLCATNDKHIIGFVTIWRDDDFIHCLFVDPNHQGKGIGQSLLNCALSHMKRPASLKCVAKNGSALSFYEHNGWQRTTINTDNEPYWNMIFA